LPDETAANVIAENQLPDGLRVGLRAGAANGDAPDPPPVGGGCHLRLDDLWGEGSLLNWQRLTRGSRNARDRLQISANGVEQIKAGGGGDERLAGVHKGHSQRRIAGAEVLLGIRSEVDDGHAVEARRHRSPVLIFRYDQVGGVRG
jgi:hypothetical protein